MYPIPNSFPTARVRLTARLAMSIPLLVLGLADARQAAAQAEVVEGHAPSRRIESIRPRTGPAGTRVSINTGGLPAITPTRIGLGAAQFGFEEIGQELTTERGRIDMTVTVPEWAHLDRPTVFIVFDFYFRPLALSNYFHATDENGILTRRGQLIHVGEPCSVSVRRVRRRLRAGGRGRRLGDGDRGGRPGRSHREFAVSARDHDLGPEHAAGAQHFAVGRTPAYTPLRRVP